MTKTQIRIYKRYTKNYVHIEDLVESKPLGKGIVGFCVNDRLYYFPNTHTARSEYLGRFWSESLDDFKFTYVKRENRRRDIQKIRSYKWEDDYFGQPHISHQESPLELIELFNRVVKDYNLGDAKLEIRNNGHTSYGSRFRVTLAPGHRRKNILLHEIAHLIHLRALKKTKPKDVMGHGPGWLTIYVILCVQYMGANTDSILDSVRENCLLIYEDFVRDAVGRIEGMGHSQEGLEYLAA